MLDPPAPSPPLQLQPITIGEAQVFVARHHRHHGAPQGGLFAVACGDGTLVLGVAVIGRPVARGNADGWTAEVTRLCVLPDVPNGCSMLYRAAWRACKALGYRRLITYTLASEHGSSLRGAGFTLLGLRGGGSWSRQDRPRVDTHPLEQKQLWEVTA